ncbi:polyphosphate kinase 2 [Dyadobacter psychrotolerans]|uniref:ADP/GDP-polyphosphate phosphotransferase n=1 Tax=Dyadobacter psychrotolerans TaxID=2541721 RepID=A0A4R5E0N8_9BACT|nr:polyphosphate kinase 2 [Dyadobacter psychrotolerans]TDE18111.1 polyphosphate kinase 2 [Dyadobacter psychrotolerans]
MKDHKKRLKALFIELVKLQRHVIASDLKLLVIVEGRDAAGKDGTIKRITKHLSPRETIVVALGKPSDVQLREWYFQRYTSHLPISGQFVLFNRSWYNRAGVEKVMGFCSEKEYELFFNEVELFERMLADSGFIILKYYLDISKEEQESRLEDRRTDKLKQWKISPIDQQAIKYWQDYSDARNKMLERTSFLTTPWFVVSADHKKHTRNALITHLLSQIDYEDKDQELLSFDDGLVYSATAVDANDRLF